MAIYRPPRSPWRARILMAAAGALIGGLIVLVLMPEGERSAAQRAAEARSELIAAEAALEIVAIEYDESVEAGEIVAEAEYNGALAALARSRDRFESVRAALEASVVAEIETAFDRIEDRMERRAPSEELSGALEALGQLLTEAVPS